MRNQHSEAEGDPDGGCLLRRNMEAGARSINSSSLWGSEKIGMKAQCLCDCYKIHYKMSIDCNLTLIDHFIIAFNNQQIDLLTYNERKSNAVLHN